MNENQPRPNSALLPALVIAIAIILHASILKGEVNFLDLSGKNKNTAQVKEVPINNTAPTTAPEAKVNVSADDDPVLGNKDAKVTIIEFSDFQCPFCKRLIDQSFAQLKKEYIDTNKVKLVYRDYPLSFHQNANISAEAAECADEQGKFWPMHDRLFEKQTEWSNLSNDEAKNTFKKYASELGVNASQFNGCLDSGKYKDEIAKDVKDANAATVDATPTLFVNGTRVVGAQPYETIKSAIEQELANVK